MVGFFDTTIYGGYFLLTCRISHSGCEVLHRFAVKKYQFGKVGMIFLCSYIIEPQKNEGRK